jgi:hypothetical protein
MTEQEFIDAVNPEAIAEEVYQDMKAGRLEEPTEEEKQMLDEIMANARKKAGLPPRPRNTN